MLSIHFFTIVLNGMPFIKDHFCRFSQLKCDWHWHIVEGVAELKNDTAWSLQNGGRVPDKIHKNGLSIDGTTEYLDKLFEENQNLISVYRKAKGGSWDGKLEMVSAPLKNLPSECLLWEVDVDELWSHESIEQIHKAFLENPSKTAAWYWCNFYVSEDKIVSTRHCYSQNPTQEWLRTWRFKSGDFWKAHEPPLLFRKLSDGKEVDVGKIDPFLHHETEEIGAVFDHFAYALEAQVRFKEQYYGYSGALEGWKKLRASQEIQPELLSKYFPWVKDSTYVSNNNKKLTEVPFGMVLIDGVAFQYEFAKAIRRVWTEIFSEWVKCGFAKFIIVLDRAGTLPVIPGIKTVTISAWEDSNWFEDSLMIERLLELYQCKTFISTYYTAPLFSPYTTLCHDFIPEVIGVDMTLNIWSDKIRSIKNASCHVCVSKNTAVDLQKIYGPFDEGKVFASRLGVSKKISNNPTVNLSKHLNHVINDKPYFLFVGERVGLSSGSQTQYATGYKNAWLLLSAFSQWRESHKYNIVFAGGKSCLEPILKEIFVSNAPILLSPTDEELKILYSRAVCLVYPSKYEGFGLPVLEAMSCGCPVIAANISSIPEVGGDAIRYINPHSVSELITAMNEMLDSSIRNKYVKLSIQQSEKFSYHHISDTIKNALIISSKLTKIDSDIRKRILNKIDNATKFKNDFYSLSEDVLHFKIMQQSKWVKFGRKIGLVK